MQAFQELLERSQKEKRGITFYLHGQTIAGVVLKINEDTVVAYNQTYDRIILRMDRVEAVAMQ
ncbi:MAG: hypothetical protein ACE5G0_07195 [Rhodothermales bacterium]